MYPCFKQTSALFETTSYPQFTCIVLSTPYSIFWAYEQKFTINKNNHPREIDYKIIIIIAVVDVVVVSIIINNKITCS